MIYLFFLKENEYLGQPKLLQSRNFLFLNIINNIKVIVALTLNKSITFFTAKEEFKVFYLLKKYEL